MGIGATRMCGGRSVIARVARSIHLVEGNPKATQRLTRSLGLRRFARDFDLHAIIGIVATVPLLIWAATGLQFEAPGLTTLWYSLTGGHPAERTSTASRGVEDVSVGQAISAAASHFPGAEVTWVGLPDEENPYYRIDLLDPDSPDLRAHSLNYHGNRSVGVDAHDAAHVQILRARPMSVSNAIADEWAGPQLISDSLSTAIGVRSGSSSA